MPYYPFPTKPSLQDLTVLHGWILMSIYGPDVESVSTRQLQPQPWIRTQEDLNATMDLVELGLVRSFNGIFYRTWKGEAEKEKLYGRQV